MSDNSLTPPKSIRARSSQRSIIRELLKLASQPDVISFAGGLPSPKSFPVKAIEKATDWVLETEGTPCFAVFQHRRRTRPPKGHCRP